MTYRIGVLGSGRLIQMTDIESLPRFVVIGIDLRIVPPLGLALLLILVQIIIVKVDSAIVDGLAPDL